MLQDLALNLISEAVGIVITVIIVDRLLERQKEKLWLPTKYQIYAKLFNTLEDFLTAIQISPTDEKEFGGRVYQYGKIKVSGYGSYKGINLSQIIKRIEIRYSTIAEGGWEYNPTAVSSLRNQISTILDSSLALLEPKVLELLLELDNSIATYNRFLPLQARPDTSLSDQTNDLAYMLSDVISKAIAVRTYLEQKADRIITIQQYFEELVKQ